MFVEVWRQDEKQTEEQPFAVHKPVQPEEPEEAVLVVADHNPEEPAEER